jgi:hypothetical protein
VPFGHRTRDQLSLVVQHVWQCTPITGSVGDTNRVPDSIAVGNTHGSTQRISNVGTDRRAICGSHGVAFSRTHGGTVCCTLCLAHRHTQRVAYGNTDGHSIGQPHFDAHCSPICDANGDTHSCALGHANSNAHGCTNRIPFSITNIRTHGRADSSTVCDTNRIAYICTHTGVLSWCSRPSVVRRC